MRSGGSASLNDARRAGQHGKHSVVPRVTTPGMAAVADTPPAATAAAAPIRAAAATAVVVAAAATLPAVAGSTQAGRGRCIRQRAQNAVGTLRFHSSRALTSRSIAGNASSYGEPRRPRAATTTSTGTELEGESTQSSMLAIWRRMNEEGGPKGYPLFNWAWELSGLQWVWRFH